LEPQVLDFDREAPLTEQLRRLLLAHTLHPEMLQAKLEPHRII
jgi:hypothetical protein